MSNPASTHFRPANGFVGDVIPFASDGTAWLFYLLDERPDLAPKERPTGMPWAAVTTTDFVDFHDRGVVLPSGGPTASDFDCYTGSVVVDDGVPHLFYTGHNPRIGTSPEPDSPDAQVVCHATSAGDLTSWVKHPEWDLAALPGYAPEDWRDPFVFRPSPGAPWQMLLATRRLDAPYRRSGIVARLESDDLISWRDAEPIWDPRRFITQECPDVFRWGDWWYLVYSEFSDSFCTRYRMSRSVDGPWLAPEDDTVDGRAFYAAKTVALGEDRYFVGWIASKQDQRDDGAWQWAGTMATLQAHQRPDGTLRFDLPESIKAAHGDRIDITDAFDPVDGADEKPGSGAEDRYAAWLGPDLPSQAVIAIEIDIAADTRSCGVLLRSSADGESTYALRLEPARDRMVIDRWPRGRTGSEQWQILGDVPHSVELERPVRLQPGRHRLEIHLDADVCVAVIDGGVALSTRLYDRLDGRIGLFAQDGAFTVNTAAISTRVS
ncbi:MAG: GH32 C-terminal domain-containing protein [Microbacteriaceae bacterium]